MDEQEFKKRCDDALNKLYRVLGDAADDYDFEADFNSGALTVEFEDPPAKFVVSPNTPVRQVWVSAHAKSYKLDWDETQQTFALPDGSTLHEIIEQAISKQLGEEVSL
jgi:iron donor protein CyaY